MRQFKVKKQNSSFEEFSISKLKTSIIKANNELNINKIPESKLEKFINTLESLIISILDPNLGYISSETIKSFTKTLLIQNNWPNLAKIYEKQTFTPQKKISLNLKPLEKIYEKINPKHLPLKLNTLNQITKTFFPNLKTSNKKHYNLLLPHPALIFKPNLPFTQTSIKLSSNFNKFLNQFSEISTSLKEFKNLTLDLTDFDSTEISSIQLKQLISFFLLLNPLHTPIKILIKPDQISKLELLNFLNQNYKKLLLLIQVNEQSLNEQNLNYLINQIEILTLTYSNLLFITEPAANFFRKNSIQFNLNLYELLKSSPENSHQKILTEFLNSLISNSKFTLQINLFGLTELLSKFKFPPNSAKTIQYLEKLTSIFQIIQTSSNYSICFTIESDELFEKIFNISSGFSPLKSLIFKKQQLNGLSTFQIHPIIPDILKSTNSKKLIQTPETINSINFPELNSISTLENSKLDWLYKIKYLFETTLKTPILLKFHNDQTTNVKNLIFSHLLNNGLTFGLIQTNSQIPYHSKPTTNLLEKNNFIKFKTDSSQPELFPNKKSYEIHLPPITPS